MMTRLILELKLVIILACYILAGENPDYNPADLPPVVDNAPGYDKACVDSWKKGAVFMKWLVRIMKLRDDGQRLDVGIGSLLTTRHVLTTCDPLWTKELGTSNPINFHVFSFVIPFAKDDGSGINSGKFPWAASQGGCVAEYYQVASGEYPRGSLCTQHGNLPFEDLTNNFVILTLVHQVTIPDPFQWQRMPFDYSVDRTLRLIKWFQTYRKARCQIPRWKKIPGGNEITQRFPNAEIEQEGFTYRAMEFKTECARLLCRDHCSSAEYVSEYEEVPAGPQRTNACIRDCIQHKVHKWRGRIFCLKKMNENIKGSEKYSVTYDLDGSQTDVSIGRDDEPVELRKSETCSNQYSISRIYGAPVVCNGEVIAIVTLCRDQYLAATPILSIRHHIFKTYPIKYLQAMVFMDGSNSTLSSTEAPAELPDE